MNEKNKVLIVLAFLFAIGFVICLLPLARADIVFQERTVMGKLFQHWEMSGDNEVTQDITFFSGLSPTDYQSIYGSDGMDANFWWYSWKKSVANLKDSNKERHYHIVGALPYQIEFIYLVMEPIVNELQKQILWNKVENEVNTEYLKHQEYYKNKCRGENNIYEKIQGQVRLIDYEDECGYCSARFFIYQRDMTKYKWNWDNFLYSNSGNDCYKYHTILK